VRTRYHDLSVISNVTNINVRIVMEAAEAVDGGAEVEEAAGGEAGTATGVVAAGIPAETETAGNRQPRPSTVLSSACLSRFADTLT
jgi:hypothetical protein